jgi:Arc/MetJ-type ribon-helix-helix transcriptional regulator
MKANAKSSITLPAGEVSMVNRLMKTLGAKSKVEVIRRGLRLLQETTDRAALLKAYADASQAVRASTLAELEELEPWAADGLGKGGSED